MGGVSRLSRLVPSHVAIVTLAASFLVTVPLVSYGSSIPMQAGVRFAVIGAGDPHSLVAGVYTVSGGASELTGELVFDADGEADAHWVFVMPGSFIATSASQGFLVVVSPSGTRNYWKVKGLATAETDTPAGSVFEGVTMSDADGSGGFTGAADPELLAVPEPVSVVLLGFGLIGLVFVGRRPTY